MVINIVLSVMAYDYPTEKLSIYLSDDGGSIITFYALFEASQFSQKWLPYCRKYNVEPRSPIAYFSSMPKPYDTKHSPDLESIKKLYEEMQSRIDISTELGRVPEEAYSQHKGFSEWKTSYISKSDHDTILQTLIDGRNPESKDVEGCVLPTVVYLAREKRPHHFHNFKAGAVNALIRVSSEISNGQIILNFDCDMYSNDSQSIRDALCFFMDEKKSNGIGYVQFPQVFENITKHDLYDSSFKVIYNVEFHGIDGFGGPMYIGTGCFHQREILCGRKYTKEYKIDWKKQITLNVEGMVHELEERAKALASCTYELNSTWAKEMGLRYGCPVEDLMTGLTIQCRGWKSVYMNPKIRSGFLGLAPTTLVDSLVQHSRWSEGLLQIMLNHCPFWHGHKSTSLGLQLSYSYGCLWAPSCLATLCYCIFPTLYMIKGISLFPEVSSPWFLSFAYIVVASYSYSLGEYLWTGGTILGWWHAQRMWLYRRTSSYLFAFIDTIRKLLGFTSLKFIVTSKVTDQDVSLRYDNEVMEFGHSPMLTVLATLAFFNMFSLLLVTVKNMTVVMTVKKKLALQIILCGVYVLVNLPLYKAALIRKDKGRLPPSVTTMAVFFALMVLFGWTYFFSAA